MLLTNDIWSQEQAEKCPSVLHYNLLPDLWSLAYFQYYDLLRVFNFFREAKGKKGDMKPGWLTQRYVFLGDYIDRCILKMKNDDWRWISSEESSPSRS